MNELDNQILDKKSWSWYDLLGQAIGKAMFPTSYTGLLRADSGVVTVDSRELTIGTSQATTSGTSWDFTSIPSWVKRITINFVGFSTNGTSIPMVQIGDGGGIETAAYTSAGNTTSGGGTNSTTNATGFIIGGTRAAGTASSGSARLELTDAATFTWTFSAMLSGANIEFGAGRKSLSAALDRVRVTMVNGTDAGDAGSINISYE